MWAAAWAILPIRAVAASPNLGEMTTYALLYLGRTERGCAIAGEEDRERHDAPATFFLVGTLIGKFK